MSRRSLISSGWVVLVAALVTGVALLLGSGSAITAPKRVSRDMTAITSATTDNYSSRASRPLTGGQMIAQARLMSEECGLGGEPGRSAPVPTVKLAAAGGLHLYVVGQEALICSHDGGDSMAANPQRRPVAESIALGGVAAEDVHGHHATIEYGRVGTSVRGARFVLSNGRSVPASVGRGWFLITWPSASSPSSAKLTTASGVETVALGAGAASPPVSCAANQSCFATSGEGTPVSPHSVSSGGVVTGGLVTVSGKGNMSSYAPGPPATWIGTMSRAAKHPIHVVLAPTGG